LRIAPVIFLSLSLLSCSETSLKDSAWTTSKDGVLFENQKFHLSVIKPESWYAQNVQEMATLQQKGGQLIAGKDDNLKAITEASLETSLPLFSFHEFEPGAPTNSTSSLISVAENISGFSGIKKGCDYVFHVKKILSQSQVTIEYEDECKIQEINGKDFSFFNSQIVMGDRIVKQKYLVCLMDRYAISFVVTKLNKENPSEVDDILNSIKIECTS